MLKKQQKRIRRHGRVRAKIKGTKDVPRFSVFRSNKHIYAQLIDDEKAVTLVAASDKILSPKFKVQSPKSQLKTKNLQKDKKEIIRTGKVAIAYEVGKLIAEKALKKNIKKVVFDKGGYKYHGRVKAVAEGARERGLKF